MPNSREPGREMAISFAVVGVVAYLIGAAYLTTPMEPAIHPQSWLARPWDLFPAVLFLAAAIGYGRRPHGSEIIQFDRAL